MESLPNWTSHGELHPTETAKAESGLGTLLETDPGRLRRGRAELCPPPDGPGEGTRAVVWARLSGRGDNGQLRVARGRARGRPQEGPEGKERDRQGRARRARRPGIQRRHQGLGG